MQAFYAVKSKQNIDLPFQKETGVLKEFGISALKLFKKCHMWTGLEILPRCLHYATKSNAVL